jgi:hypothetical protein
MDIESLLDDLSCLLRRLHKALIEIEAENFGPISSSFQLLNLVIHHPHFAWLHSLSELMVELDELREDVKSVDDVQAAVLRATVERLVGPRPPLLSQFRERYLMLLQQSPEVAIAHAELRRVLDRLPGMAAEEPRK